MTDQPADLLTAAAQRLINGAPEIADSNIAWTLAEWLKDAATREAAKVESAHRVWPNPDADDIADRDRWIANHVDQHALDVARAVLGQDGGQ
ncbi:hypothetical protein AB0D10_05455 [Kitasatospora sp. NPDC048545]|uniref:hypothetical protein n=1 Tax=Kitasatospora sp. NPDC048545 TaxID=3157208 RepID=UPI003403F0B9